ncbi:MAG TPA: cupin domain-containing protein [Candidatus Binataceae bacterium]|nr:cupin domain-containing protein [Candidatus Binataceae bacterium]
MLTRREMMKSFGIGSTMFAAGILAALADSPVARAAKPDSAKSASGVSVTKIFDYPITELPGRNGIVVRVDFAPGAAAAPHHHPGSVFAYVLSGTIESQVAPGPLAKYATGEMWYEEPRAFHKVSRNASKTAPASILAFMIVPHGAALVKPGK